jgi:hypothetical protein
LGLPPAGVLEDAWLGFLVSVGLDYTSLKVLMSKYMTAYLPRFGMALDLETAQYITLWPSSFRPIASSNDGCIYLGIWQASWKTRDPSFGGVKRRSRLQTYKCGSKLAVASQFN